MILQYLTVIFTLVICQFALGSSFKDAYKRPDAIPFPDSNKFSSAKYDLGWKLFFDPRLSGSDFISCASCHNPALAWGDGMATGTGHGMKKLGRRTPTILNLAWGGPYMWDGRAETLEEQALGPIQADVEMNMPIEVLIKKLSAIKGYRLLFKQAFGDSKITSDRIGKAIATFERKVVSGQSPFDDWIDGKHAAISDSAKRGFALFNTKAKCADCHSGWRFTDDGYHDIGVKSKDVGRAKIIPGIDVLKHAFKTPTLRNVTQRAPYMHNGSEKTLEEVVELYDRGGRVDRPNKSPSVIKLKLSSQEKKDLVEFLKTLTSEDKPMTIPSLPI